MNRTTEPTKPARIAERLHQAGFRDDGTVDDTHAWVILDSCAETAIDEIRRAAIACGCALINAEITTTKTGGVQTGGVCVGFPLDCCFELMNGRDLEESAVIADLHKPHRFIERFEPHSGFDHEGEHQTARVMVFDTGEKITLPDDEVFRRTNDTDGEVFIPVAHWYAYEQRRKQMLGRANRH